ncbi:DUF3156 family protein [Chimaeribacter californicus]|nr:DUF3156 family protein [Chimaeribacter californicus]
MSCVHCYDNALLRRLSHDLGGWPVTAQGPQAMRLHLDEQLHITIMTRRRRLFMGEINSARFVAEGECCWQETLKVQAHQPGWLQRRPVTFHAPSSPSGAQPLLAFLAAYPVLAQTLGELDYRHFSLSLAAGRWRCEIEPYAASDVVCRLPPLRRYLRLPPRQRMLLLSVLRMVAQLMQVADRNTAG